MSELSDAELEAFVAASAAMLSLQLDAVALAAVRDAMRGVVVQAALVVGYPAGRAET